MLDTNYKKPFVIAVIISSLWTFAFGLSLQQMGGTGFGGDIMTEITFDIDSDGESFGTETGKVEIHHADPAATDAAKGNTDNDKSAQEEKHPEAVEPKQTAANNLYSTPDVNTPKHMEWGYVRNPDSVNQSDEPVAEMQDGLAKSKEGEPEQKSFGSFSRNKKNPNSGIYDGTNGNNLPDQESDLSFMSPVALGLLSRGLQEELKPTPERNATSFLKRVQEQARQSHLQGAVAVKVHFGDSGEVVGTRIIDDKVAPAIKDEALRIVKHSGTIENNLGHPTTLTIPVVLGE